jgi:hypothetical protein
MTSQDFIEHAIGEWMAQKRDMPHSQQEEWLRSALVRIDAAGYERGFRLGVEQGRHENMSHAVKSIT